jgi:4-amino-4-deoxy-L-arabinose transferase-like glycosyltransferase
MADILLLPHLPQQIVPFFASHGIIGDYFVDWMLYTIGGRFLIIGTQVAFMAYAVVCVWRLALLVSEKRGVALTAAVMFGLLPHNIVAPHTLSAEGFFVPLIVCAFYQFGRYCLETQRLKYLALSGLFFGFAAIVRVLSCLWPIFALIALAFYRPSLRAAASFLILSFSPLLLWMAFIFAQTGQISEGPSPHTTAYNFYHRIIFITDQLPPRERDLARSAYLPRHQGEKAGFGDYLRFAAAYPGANLKRAGYDLFVYTSKSGVEMLTVQYFNLLESDKEHFQNTDTGWRTTLEKQGIRAVATDLIGKHPFVAITSLLGVAIFTLVFVAAIVGAWHLVVMRKSSPSFPHNLALVVFPLYVFVVSLPVDMMQSRHRAPAEFAICILASIGIWLTAKKWLGHSGLAK